MSIASGYGPNWTTAEGRAVDLQKRVVELEQQLAAAQAEAQALRFRNEELEAVLRAETLRLKESRAELARVREEGR